MKKGEIQVKFKGGIWDGKTKRTKINNATHIFKVSHVDGVDTYTREGNTYTLLKRKGALMQMPDGRLKELERLEDALPDHPVWIVGERYKINGTMIELRKITKKDLVFRPVPLSAIGADAGNTTPTS